MAMYYWEADREDFLVAAGDGPCVILAVGAREHEGRPDWGGDPVNATAARYGASAGADTRSPKGRTLA